MKEQHGADTMRAIAEEAFALVRSFGGSHSGEHGDGIVRSEFNDTMFGPVLPQLFRQVKAMFDPAGMFNPGKITDAPRMDDRSLFRFAPGYRVENAESVLDWPNGPARPAGCRALSRCATTTGPAGSWKAVMCPSYRATRNERDAVRGRANRSASRSPDSLAPTP